MVKVFLSALVMILVCFSLFAGDGKIQKKKDSIANRYVVQFHDFVASPKNEARAIVGLHGGKVRHVYQYGVTGFSIDASPEQAAAISADPRVKHVEEDSPVTMFQVAPGPSGWALDRINQRSLPLDHLVSNGCNAGTGVEAYILDTGIEPNATEFGTRLINGFTVGSNFSDEWYSDGHGTAVASLVGGATYGVAKDVTLINVKIVAPPDHIGVQDAIAGIDYVVSRHLATPTVPKVINFSQGYLPSSMLDSKIIDAVQRGITFVVAAGNFTQDNCMRDPSQKGQSYLGTPNTMANPSPFSTITVTGSRLMSNYSQDVFTNSANFGPCVDIHAPGQDVRALHKLGYAALFSGTSMAAPLVAGAVARHLNTFIGSPLPTPENIENILKSNATANLLIPRDAATPNLLLYTFNARCRSTRS